MNLAPMFLFKVATDARLHRWEFDLRHMVLDKNWSNGERHWQRSIPNGTLDAHFLDTAMGQEPRKEKAK